MQIDPTNPAMDWLFPRRCFACNFDTRRGMICAGCRSLCNVHPNPLGFNDQNHVALFNFEATIKLLIKSVKYFNEASRRHLLLSLIRQQLDQSIIPQLVRAWAPTTITYIPSHWLNRFWRGIELPNVFAHMLANKFELPVVSLLARTNQENQAQRSRSERLSAIKGAFALRRRDKRYERLLLVDDVMTTGATLNEAAHVLSPIALSVARLTIAKTP